MSNGPPNNWTGPLNTPKTVDGSTVYKGSPLTGSSKLNTPSGFNTAELLKNGKAPALGGGAKPLQSAGALAGGGLSKSVNLTPASEALKAITPKGGLGIGGAGGGAATGLATPVGSAGAGAIGATVAAGLGIGIAIGEGIRRGGLALEEAGLIADTPIFEEYPPGFWDRQPANSNPKPVPIPNDPPFTGGQMPQVRYLVKATYNGSPIVYGSTPPGFRPILGPLEIETPVSMVGNTPIRTIRVRHSLSNGERTGWIALGSSAAATFFLAGVARFDGQPDTGGNPDGGTSPGTAPGTIPGYIPASDPLPSPGAQPGQPSASPLGQPSASPLGSPASPGLIPAPSAQPLGKPAPKPFPFAEPGSLPSPIIPILAPNPAGNRAPGLAKPPKVSPKPQGQPDRKTPVQPGACSTGCALQAQAGQARIEQNINNIIAGNTIVGQPTDLTPVLANQEIIKGQNVVTHATQAVMNNKLGAQVPGGITGFLGRLDDFIQAAFRFTKVDKILNALNTILLLHNAAMLSRNLAASLGELATQALTVFGVKDAEGNPIDVNDVIGKSFTELAESVLGETLFTGITEAWAKANNIIRSATQIIWTIRSLTDSAREIGEWTAENVGKIGNALKKWRVVGEDAYKWMPERVRGQSRWEVRVNRAREGIESLDDAASSLSGVLGEVQNIQEETQELIEQKQRFSEAIAAAVPQDRPDNQPVATAVAASNAASAGKNREPGDATRGDEL